MTYTLQDHEAYWSVRYFANGENWVSFVEDLADLPALLEFIELNIQGDQHDT